MNEMRKTKFQPVVLDEQGMIRKRFNALKRKTRVEKCALAAKIFEVGIERIEREISKTT